MIQKCNLKYIHPQVRGLSSDSLILVNKALEKTCSLFFADYMAIVLKF